MEMRSWAFGEPFELLEIDRIPRANRIITRKENIKSIDKSIIDDDALRGGPLPLLINFIRRFTQSLTKRKSPENVAKTARHLRKNVICLDTPTPTKDSKND
ncbi:Uncharacterized protein Fot_35728 [Forsythia ovata]|uniref:Uncharacterized protein n=1 Tax=Forsythia ovata TaxID=205694 RepID=A0ABD1SMD5_9LAMI